MWLWYLTGCHWRGMTHALTPNHMHADPHQHTHTHWPVKIHTLTTDHIHCPSIIHWPLITYTDPQSHIDHWSHTLTLNHTYRTSLTHILILDHTDWPTLIFSDSAWSHMLTLTNTRTDLQCPRAAVWWLYCCPNSILSVQSPLQSYSCQGAPPSQHKMI